MKRFTKSGSASDVAKASAKARNCELEPNTKIDPAGGPFHGTCGPVAAFKAGFVTRNIDPFCAHIEQVDKKVVAQGFRTIGEDAFFGAMAIGAQNPKPADQRSHLRCVERQQLGPIYEELFGRDVEVCF